MAVFYVFLGGLGAINLQLNLFIAVRAVNDAVFYAIHYQ